MAYEVEVTLKIKLRYPIRSVGRLALRSHIEDAVESWGGQCHPDDLMFDVIERANTSGVREVK